MNTTTMHHSATYLDNSHYLISDKAAGALCRALNRKLPVHGYEVRVCLTVGELSLFAWLNRTPTRHSLLAGPLGNRRGWRWCLHGITADGNRDLKQMGRAFQFAPAA